MANTTENQGCLSLLLPFLRSKNESVPDVLPYRLRDNFLSPAELSFYKILSTVIGSRFTIQSKVRLADIFFVARPNENFSYFNKIAQRHLDFLVCDSSNMKPVLGIELDDSSHHKMDRQKRDKFMDAVFQTAKLPLLRFPVQRAYNTKEIATQIAPILKGETIPPDTQMQTLKTNDSSKKAVPLCPKCGIPMVLRTMKKGKYQGKQFYICPNYQRCRQVKPVQTKE